jgi:hypothetical protein
MPAYQCHFLNDDGQPVRTEVLRASATSDARREAMTLLTKVGRFSGFELLAEGRIVAEYRPVKERC